MSRALLIGDINCIGNEEGPTSSSSSLAGPTVLHLNVFGGCQRGQEEDVPATVGGGGQTIRESLKGACQAGRQPVLLSDEYIK